MRKVEVRWERTEVFMKTIDVPDETDPVKFMADFDVDDLADDEAGDDYFTGASDRHVVEWQEVDQ